jgi:hypothetical protein
MTHEFKDDIPSYELLAMPDKVLTAATTPFLYELDLCGSFCLVVDSSAQLEVTQTTVS